MSNDKASLTPMTKLLLVDCDGTIRKPLSRNQFIQHPRDQKIIAGAKDAIAEQLYTLELLPQILCIYFCPDMKGKHCWLASKKIDDARSIHIAWASQWSGTFRKPQPGMINAAILNYCGENKLENCLYVGDALRQGFANAMKTLRQQPPKYDLCGLRNGEMTMTETIEIPSDTYQRLLEHLQAHAPTDSWAAELLQKLERKAKPTHQLPSSSVYSRLVGISCLSRINSHF